MNISTLAKILGVSVGELRETGQKEGLQGFSGRNTRIPYQSAVEITKILRPDKAEKLKDDDKIYLPNSLTVSDFAEAIGKPPGMVVKTLVLNGVMTTLNEKIDFDTASLIAEEMRVKVYPENPEELNNANEVQDTAKLFETTNQDLEGGNTITRPPIVTVMGHVDHGKTTLLDTIRKANVASGEAGAITQHISSYQIEHSDKKITFVDTPGHEAFTAMRARGTQLADFIILMVSATEGPKPQTVEVIERAKISKTPIIVAINKIDLPEADIEKTKADIAAFSLVPEEWGGDVPYIPISAKNGTGIEKILETILLMSEVGELKGEVDCPGQAVVIESHLDKNKGVVATVLVTKDKVKVGDIFGYGQNTGKIRKITDSIGGDKKLAKICEPVEITGLNEVANTGDIIKVYENQKEAQNAANLEKVKNSQKKIYYAKSRESTEGDINVILKADVAGSLEALKETILKIPQDKVKVIIKAESIGQVNENDVEFAKTANAAILAFHTSINSQVEDKIKRDDINLIQSDVIYEILEWVEEQILKNTKHEVKTVSLGKAKVLATFKSDKPKIQVFGGEVIEGKILDNKELRIIRKGEEAGRLEIVELQRNKVKAKEININQQFGVSATGKIKVEEGDIIESIDEVVIK